MRSSNSFHNVSGLERLERHRLKDSIKIPLIYCIKSLGRGIALGIRVDFCFLLHTSECEFIHAFYFRDSLGITSKKIILLRVGESGRKIELPDRMFDNLESLNSAFLSSIKLAIDRF